MIYLEKLVVENFQSHEHTKIDFCPGLNVIVGPSDHGKSALVRALRWLFYNEPRGANFIRVGARTCRVSVELNNGIEISRVRSISGKNQYILKLPGRKESVFEGFGNEIPDEIISATGIRKILIDDRNKVELNFGTQLEGPFLLSENGAVRAKIIGQLGGVHILDLAQKLAGTDMRRLREEESELTTVLQSLDEELRKYDHLPHVANKIKQLEDVFQQIADLAKDIETLQNIQNEWEETETALKNIDCVISQFIYLEDVEEKVQTLERMGNTYRTIVDLALELDILEKKIDEINRVITQTRLLQDAENILNVLGVNMDELYELDRIRRDLDDLISSLNRASWIVSRTEILENADKLITAAAEVLKKLIIYRELHGSWEEHERDYRGVCIAVDRYQKDVEKYLAAFRDVLVKLSRCPVCYGEMSEEAIDRVLAEYQ